MPLLACTGCATVDVAGLAHQTFNVSLQHSEDSKACQILLGDDHSLAFPVRLSWTTDYGFHPFYSAQKSEPTRYGYVYYSPEALDKLASAAAGQDVKDAHGRPIIQIHNENWVLGFRGAKAFQGEQYLPRPRVSDSANATQAELPAALQHVQVSYFAIRPPRQAFSVNQEEGIIWAIAGREYRIVPSVHESEDSDTSDSVGVRIVMAVLFVPAMVFDVVTMPVNPWSWDALSSFVP